MDPVMKLEAKDHIISGIEKNAGAEGIDLQPQVVNADPLPQQGGQGDDLGIEFRFGHAEGRATAGFVWWVSCGSRSNVRACWPHGSSSSRTLTRAPLVDPLSVPEPHAQRLSGTYLRSHARNALRT